MFFPLNYHKNFVDCSKINLNLCEIVRKMTFLGLNFGNYTRLSLIWRYANKMKFWKGYFPQNFFNFFYFSQKGKFNISAQPEQHCLKCFPYIAPNLVINFVRWYNPNGKFKAKECQTFLISKLVINPLHI